MPKVDASIEVNVPVADAYRQWTRFDEFPRFMSQIVEVRVLDGSHFHWRANYGPMEEEWDAEIVEDTPERRLAWRSTSGHHNNGVVEFEALSPTTTRVRLRMDYETAGIKEEIGRAIGMDELVIRQNLQQFKRYMEGGAALH